MHAFIFISLLLTHCSLFFYIFFTLPFLSLSFLSLPFFFFLPSLSPSHLFPTLTRFVSRFTFVRLFQPYDLWLYVYYWVLRSSSRLSFFFLSSLLLLLYTLQFLSCPSLDLLSCPCTLFIISFLCSSLTCLFAAYNVFLLLSKILFAPLLTCMISALKHSFSTVSTQA